MATPTLVKGARSTRSTIALKLAMAISGLVFIGFALWSSTRVRNRNKIGGPVEPETVMTSS